MAPGPGPVPAPVPAPGPKPVETGLKQPATTAAPAVNKSEGRIAQDGTLIRSFFDKGIQAQIDKAIATLPPDTHGAVIAVATTKSASLAIVGKKQLGGGEVAWTVVAAKPYDGPVEAEAAVRYRW